MSPTPVWRPTARLLVADPQGRVLLFSALDQTRGSFWFTPGGGVNRGETISSAAVRELAEETGYLCDESDIGPVVATRAGPWWSDEGKYYLGADSFFFVRVDKASINTDGQEPLERSVITGHRWWTVTEMREAADVIRPPGLANLMTLLFRQGAPDQPVRLPAR